MEDRFDLMNLKRITLEARSQRVCKATKMDAREKVRKELQGSCQETWDLPFTVHLKLPQNYHNIVNQLLGFSGDSDTIPQSKIESLKLEKIFLKVKEM